MKKKKEMIPQNLLQTQMTLADRRYRVDEFLGDNGLTITYKGYDTFRKKVIVIRELFPQAIMQRNLEQDHVIECKRLSDEGLFLSMKEHMVQRAKKLITLYPLAHTANVLTYLEERETVYTIEEYADGPTLAAHLFKRHSAKFSVDDLMKYLGPLMDTLDTLHAKGIFHGAICPENIRILAGGKPVLVGLANPMEDVAVESLNNPSVRKDGYSPVELYLPEAQRGAATDVYEMAALFYFYGTGEMLPAYFDRINEEKMTFQPDQMMTQIMRFQSEAIMKGVSVYAFDRYQSMAEFKKNLMPEDMDFDSLRAESETTKNLIRKPFWYAYEEKIRRRYNMGLLLILLVGLLVLGPKLYEVATDVRINHFYDRFNEASLYQQCEMLAALSEKERKQYTNDYLDLDSSLTDEERSEAMITKYYDFQLNKYVTYDRIDRKREVYEYMQIDYRDGVVWINYLSSTENTHQEISLPKRSDGSYEVRVDTTDADGNTKTEIVMAKP